VDNTLPASALPVMASVLATELIVVASPDPSWVGRPLRPGRSATVGRSDEADRTLDDPRMSRVHARIAATQVEDLGSRNGVFVDGRPVVERTPLQAGAVVRIGDTCVVVVPGGGREVEGALLGRSPGIESVRRSLGKVAGTDLSVLVTGETGTGKEVVAAEIHRLSGRRGRFVPVNCAAIAPTLAESTLFGHSRGAFTGATTARDGLFVEADGGTLFLDEVGELEMGLQAKLLRVLEDGRVTPLGGGADRVVDVRVIAATNRAIRGGEALRSDLLTRLDEWPLSLPPLRQRLEDVPLLLEHFGVGGPVAADAVEALLLHDWPGNVRELRNVARRIAVGKPARVTVDSLPEQVRDRFVARRTGQGDPLDPSETDVEPLPTAATLTRDQAIAALRASRGNVSHAARALGIGRKTLYRRIAEWGIEVDAIRT